MKITVNEERKVQTRFVVEIRFCCGSMAKAITDYNEIKILVPFMFDEKVGVHVLLKEGKLFIHNCPFCGEKIVTEVEKKF